MSKPAQLSRFWYAVHRFTRHIWTRVAVISLLALVAPVTASWLGPFVPSRFASALGTDALVRILEVLATAMLTVSTFSLAVMVSARQAASMQVTPRSHRLILEDTTTHGVLATFIGAFVFSLVSLIVVSTGFYVDEAAAVIMVFTLLVIALVVIAMVRWIEHLAGLGSVLETTRRVEREVLEALDARDTRRCLGARPIEPGATPEGLRILESRRSGYIQHVDIRGLDKAAEAGAGIVEIVEGPGALVVEGEPLLRFTGSPDEDDLRHAFTIGPERTFDQDPRFGLIVLSEIAQRALSPGVNDPGTAIDVLGRHMRLLLGVGRQEAEVEYPRVSLAPIAAADMVQDSFHAIARDGAAMVEVQVRLQKALAALAERGAPDMAAAALAMSRRALTLSEESLRLERDREMARAAAPGARYSAAAE